MYTPNEIAKIKEQALSLTHKDLYFQDKELIEDIQRLCSTINNENRNVIFFGEFKSGKSTLVNSIIGMSLLPTKANRATGVISRLTYDKRAEAIVEYKYAAPKERKYKFSIHKVQQYILLDTSTAIATPPENVKEVIFHLPQKLLTKCSLIDSPGVMDNQELTDLSLAVIKESDLGVLVLSADKLLSDSEKKLAAQTWNTLGGNIIFLVNRMDLVKKKEVVDVKEWAEYTLNKLGNITLPFKRLYFVAAENHLLAKQNPKSEVEDSEELIEFEMWLEQLFATSLGYQVAYISRLSNLHELTEMLQHSVNENLKTEKTQLADLNQKVTEEITSKKNELHKKVLAEQTRYEAFRKEISRLSDNYIKDIDNECRSIIEAQNKWEKRTKAVFIDKGNIFASEVRKSILTSLLHEHDIKPMQFRLIDKDISIIIPNNSGEQLLNIVARKKVQERRKERIHDLAKEKSLDISGKAFQHIDYLNDLLWDMERSYAPTSIYAKDVTEVETKIKDWNDLHNWVSTLRNLLKQGENQILSNNYVFHVQSELFVNEIRQRLLFEISRYYRIKSAKVSLIIQEEIEKWTNGKHYNSNWLQTLCENTPAKGKKITDLLKETRIESQIGYPLRFPFMQIITGIIGCISIYLYLIYLNIQTPLLYIFTGSSFLLLIPLLLLWWRLSTKRKISLFLEQIDSLTENLIGEITKILKN